MYIFFKAVLAINSVDHPELAFIRVKAVTGTTIDQYLTGGATQKTFNVTTDPTPQNFRGDPTVRQVMAERTHSYRESRHKESVMAEPKYQHFHCLLTTFEHTTNQTVENPHVVYKLSVTTYVFFLFSFVKISTRVN